MPISGSPDSWEKDVNSTDAPRANVSKEEQKAMIAALLYERESCEKRGLEERVKLIDQELRRYGHGASAPAKRAERRPAAAVRNAEQRDA